MRSKPVMRNTTSNRKQSTKVALTQASQLWRDLSPADRDGWEWYAKTIEVNTPYRSSSPTARSLFISNISSELFLRSIGMMGGVFNTDPPIIPGLLGAGSIIVADSPLGSKRIMLTYSNPNDVLVNVVINKSAEFIPTRVNIAGKFRSRKYTFSDVNPGSTKLNITVLTDSDRVMFFRIRFRTFNPPVRTSSEFRLRGISS